MAELIELVARYGVPLVFAWVLLEQLGLPLPAYPVLVVAGSLGAGGELSLGAAGAAAVLACLVADGVWFVGGRRYGARVLALLCRLSTSPGACERHSQAVFVRYGARALLVSKFIPGFATVASTLAGATEMRLRRFLLLDLAGTSLWVGSGLALGHAFAPTVLGVLAWLEASGTWGALALCVAVLGVAAQRAWRHYRQRQQRRAASSERALTTLDGG
jgi:membrane protein DedA with SNARE-associated domain